MSQSVRRSPVVPDTRTTAGEVAGAMTATAEVGAAVTAGFAVELAGGAAYGLARGWVLENTLFRSQGSEDPARSRASFQSETHHGHPARGKMLSSAAQCSRPLPCPGLRPNGTPPAPR